MKLSITLDTLTAIVKCLSADLQRIAVKTNFSGVSAVICPDCNIHQSFPDFWRPAAKKAAASSKNSFISLRRLFSFSNAFIRFLICWFSSAIFRDSSGLRSPQPISRFPLFVFFDPAVQRIYGYLKFIRYIYRPYFFASFTACTLYSFSYCLFSDIPFPPFFLFPFFFFEVGVSSFIILHHLAFSLRCVTSTKSFSKSLVTFYITIFKSG